MTTKVDLDTPHPCRLIVFAETGRILLDQSTVVMSPRQLADGAWRPGVDRVKVIDLVSGDLLVDQRERP